MPDLAADLTFMIRAEMTRRGLRQKDVAAEVATNDSTLTRLFQGKSIPDAPCFARICLWLKTDPAVFAVEAASEAYRRGRADQAAQVRAVLEGEMMFSSVPVADLRAQMHQRPLGAYRLFWKSGGSSVAVVGQFDNGTRWYACANWTADIGACDGLIATDWSRIERVEEIAVGGDSDA